MRIFSEILEAVDQNGQPVPVFALYLDTQATGNPEKDVHNCGTNIANLKMDAESITNLMIPMLSELIEAAYGNPTNKEAITDWHSTGFDTRYPNGVNTGIYDK